MFLGEACQVFTKTGSLGQRYFTQDCGVIRLPGRDQPAATFGYCAEGLRLPTVMVDVAMGMVGLEMAVSLGLEVQPNADWSPEAARLLLGGRQW